MTYILGLSGKKQSGKNTAFNFLLGIEMLKLSIVRDQIEITPKGRLYISDIFGNEEFKGIFDIDRNTQSMYDFCDEYIYPFIKNYSMADALKKDICMSLLGLSYDSCYGSNEDKLKPTHIRWEDMPGNTGQSGYMSGREVLQYVGTNIFRRMYSKVWARATMNKISKDNSKFAIITDVRFPDEVEYIKNSGGKVIRLTRNLFPEDTHDSEISLDPQVYNWDNFDHVLDNANMSISEQNEELYKTLLTWGWIDEIQQPN